TVVAPAAAQPKTGSDAGAAVSPAAGTPAPGVPAAGTPAGTPPNRADQIVSPEVHADRKVTFRLYAPKATSVTLAGEWTRAGAKPNTPEKMTKDAEGVWSLTVGPLPPNVYIYFYNLDGVNIADPVNPSIKLRARTSASMVEVPGNEPWTFTDVPHGNITIHTHAAPTLGGAMRRVLVYTPPGYERQTASRYPVTYLLHGNNDLEVGWTMAGHANLIFDNFIARKEMVPAIVVMPWGHALPYGTRPAQGEPSNNDLFERYLIADVMPLVESKYRTAGGRRRRALVGLSMGGTQALQIGLRHRKIFSSVSMFGAGMTRVDYERKYGPLIGAVAKEPGGPGIFYVGTGKEDYVQPRAKELAEALNASGVRTIYEEVEGGHTYPVWRTLLTRAAPLLFQKTPPVQAAAAP
ncbi:MAG TPA: alpha/beta hydrolase-fold protein, partial [Polyangia bacterium]